MTTLPRDKKLFLDFCANMNPGPLTDAERREYQGHFEYFLSLAREGDAARQHDVGVKYMEGFWVEADHKQAAYWFTQAANNGDVDAQEALAALYCLGIGVERNPIKAAQWMSLAAEGGSPSAQFDLARMFQAGAGSISLFPITMVIVSSAICKLPFNGPRGRRKMVTSMLV